MKENNELEPKPFQIFLNGGPGVGKSFLVTAIIEHVRILRYPSQNLDNLFVHLLLNLPEKLLLMPMVLHCILRLTSLLNQD